MKVIISHKDIKTGGARGGICTLYTNLAMFIKMNLLRDYQQKYTDFLVFHAGSVLHLPMGKGIVFSTPEEKSEGNGKVLGKTTAVLANILNQKREFAYCSNDEVVLVLKNDRLVSLPFPNEIPIRAGTLRAIQEEGYWLKLEEWRGFDEQTREEIYVSTPGAIKTMGFSLAELGEKINTWAFVDLSPTWGDCLVEFLDSKRALTMFITTIFRERMAQARGNLHWAEMGAKELDMTLKSKDITVAENFFRVLHAKGVSFVKLSGGVERQTLQEISQKLVEIS